MPTKEAAKPGEDATDMPGISRQYLQFSSTLRKVSRSGCRSQVDMLNLSHRSSHRYRCPETELLKEIAALELEVFHLERYLLSLYRAAFEHHLTASRDKEQACESPSTCQVESPLKDSSVQEKCESKLDSGKHPRNDLADSKDGNAPPTGKRSGDSSRPTPCHRSLADHLDSSLVECVCNTPSKLSEEIIRCISSIYNKLADQPVPQTDLSASPISSISSSSTFSSQDTYDAWSPKYHYESTMSPHHSKRPKDIQGPYSRMLEVRKICINGSRFDYAAKMLQNFRALICQLEAVDPIKMEHEEKLAFWINIHNALVMHAYLAYGLRQNQMRSTSSIMKAAYNVGGLSINAQQIQSSIFGCQPHRPELRLQKLFSQSQKFMNGRLKHPYAVNQPEPLVHFALCMGAYSDPAVRIYTAKNVLEELELAKDEFVRSKVSIRKETRIILPKILQYHARDAAMDLSATLKMVHDCMPETQQKAIQMCLKGRPERCVEWSSYKSDFRYIINEELAKE